MVDGMVAECKIWAGFAVAPCWQQLRKRVIPAARNNSFSQFRRGNPKGDAVPLWHTTLLARCSVLYLLARLARKCVLTLGGNTLLSDRKADWFL